jgi:ribosomal protein S18 acetylase RimI-like enzyme
MDVRPATREDIEGVRDVALASLSASYGHAIESELIEEAVEQWYDPDDLAADLEDDDAVFVVAVDNGVVVGFAQSYVVKRRETVGELDWLHVDPDSRGRGIGAQLLKRVEAAMVEHGVARLEGRVLVANEAGADFYEQQGYDQVGEREVRIGDGTFVERAYSKLADDATGGEVVLERRSGPDDQFLYVAYDETVRGSTGTFYAVYADEDRQDRWGWFCGEDESFAVAVDAMDRFECGDCGNRSKPSRWDAAYL